MRVLATADSRDGGGGVKQGEGGRSLRVTGFGEKPVAGVAEAVVGEIRVRVGVGRAFVEEIVGVEQGVDRLLPGEFLQSASAPLEEEAAGGADDEATGGEVLGQGGAFRWTAVWT